MIYLQIWIVTGIAFWVWSMWSTITRGIFFKVGLFSHAIALGFCLIAWPLILIDNHV